MKQASDSNPNWFHPSVQVLVWRNLRPRAPSAPSISPSKSCFWNWNSHYQSLPPRVTKQTLLLEFLQKRYLKQNMPGLNFSVDWIISDSSRQNSVGSPSSASSDGSSSPTQTGKQEKNNYLIIRSSTEVEARSFKYAHSDNIIRNIFEWLSSWVHILVFIFLSIGAHRSECLIRIQLLINQDRESELLLRTDISNL